MRKTIIFFLFISVNIFIGSSLYGQIISCRCNFKPCLVSDSNRHSGVKIRGHASCFNYEDPLLVIDGVLFQYDHFQNINPNDIESITILKDATATAVYCNRGTRGVILVVTKKEKIRKFIIKDFLDGSRIAGATVSFISSDKRDMIMTAANDSGIVITNKLKGGFNYEIMVSAVGYKNLRMSFENRFINKENDVLMERDIKYLKEIVISCYPAITCRRTISCGFKVSTSVRRESIIDKPVSFSVFPNPVKAGTTINIEWKQSETGEYVLQLFNQAGQLTFNKQMWIDDEGRALNLEVPHVAAGNYFFRMTNKKSGKAFTEKIIIQ